MNHLLLLLKRAKIVSPFLQTLPSQPLGTPRIRKLLYDTLDNLSFLSAVHADPRQSDPADAQIYEPAT